MPTRLLAAAALAIALALVLLRGTPDAPEPVAGPGPQRSTPPPAAAVALAEAPDDAAAPGARTQATPVGVQADLDGAPSDVEPDPVGTVIVDVFGLGPAEDLDLIVTTRDGALRREFPLVADRRVRLEEWPAGRVSARVQRGRDLSDTKRFGSASGVLVAGEALELRIDVDPEAARPIATFDLTLDVTVPRAWALDELRVHCRLELSPSGADGHLNGRETPLEPEAQDGPQRFRFEFGPQPAGTWVATFTPSQTRVVLPHEAPGSHAIRLPEPAQVTVVTTDPSTGLAVGGAWVLWYCELDGPSSGHFLMDAQPLEQPGHYGFRAPAGRIGLDVEHDDYGSTYPSFELVPGEQTLTVALPAGPEPAASDPPPR